MPFNLPISTTTSGGSSWTRPSDWIDISTVNDNEILILVGDFGTGIGFATTIASSGTYSIDWGDGTVETSRASGTTYQHQYIVGGGTACSLGYTTYKIRIYGATGNITKWQVKRHSYTSRTQLQSYLDINFGTSYIIDYSYCFYYSTSPYVYCYDLQKVTIKSFQNCTTTASMFFNCYALASVTLPTSWGLVNNCSNMFYKCYSLPIIKLPISWGSMTNCSNMFFNCYSLPSATLPTSWGLVNNCSNMFLNCYALSNITLPISWGSMTNCSNMFQSCYSLPSVTLPTSWGLVNNCSGMFSNCYVLTSVTLPISWGSVVTANSVFQNCYALCAPISFTSWGALTNFSALFDGCWNLPSITLPTIWGNISACTFMLSNCYQLKTVNNIQYLGSTTTSCDFSGLFVNSEYMQSPITIASLISAISFAGASGYVNKISSIRLTNASSTFTGSSPQIDVSYTSLDTTALNTLFGDLPTVSGKTIKITGATGAATCTTSIATAKGWTVTN